jgi:flagellar protein FliS
MNQYFENQVKTASPEQLLIMLYSGAIRFISEAEEAMVARKPGHCGGRISKAMAIISELSNTLDYEIGGEIAENLASLYLYMNRELLQANVEDDLSRLEMVKDMLIGLRETWLQAIDKVRAESAAAEAVPAKKSEAASVGYKPLTVSL